MKKFICFAGMAVVIIAAILFLQKEGFLLPGWIRWEERQLETGDEGPGSIVLENRRVVLSRQGEILWASPEKTLVQDVLWCDVDRDGDKELLLLDWRKGTYGEARPFWVKETEESWSQHIDIYDWNPEEKKISAIWMASDIGLDAARWTYDEDHRYLLIEEKEQNVSGWAWLQWGLERVPISFTVAAVGDNLLHEGLYRQGLAQGSFDFLYQDIRSQVQETDLAFVNQETPLVTDHGMYGGYPSFGTPAEAAKALREAGFDVLTCATNHALDRGMTGIDMTVDTCQDLGLISLGIQSSEQTGYEPYQLIERRGLRIALLNYTESLNGQPMPEQNPYAVHTLEEETVSRDLEAAREAADVVLVFVHWGTEYGEEPDEQQQKWTRLFLEKKVDVVIGTHPHVLQPCELLIGADGHQMLVYYSLGNFVSAQDKPGTEVGGMASFTVALTMEGCTITDYRLEELVKN